MTIKQLLSMVVDNPVVAWDYVQGNVRYYLHNKYPRLIRKSIKDMVEQRKDKAQRCYVNGECIHCGCATPQLFYADRGCKKEKDACYEKRNSKKITLDV